MAKVVAPLQSFSASGKVGKSLVFFSHLGRNIVRGLVTPANPMTTNQGDTRLLLAGIGRAYKAVAKTGTLVEALKTVVPSGQTWNSYLASISLSQFATPSALDTAFDNHAKASIFTAQAALLGLSDVTISYAGTLKTIPAGAILYGLAASLDAVNAQNPGIFGSSAPWDEVLASWVSSDIVAFVADIQATV